MTPPFGLSHALSISYKMPCKVSHHSSFPAVPTFKTFSFSHQVFLLSFRNLFKYVNILQCLQLDQMSYSTEKHFRFLCFYWSFHAHARCGYSFCSRSGSIPKCRALQLLYHYYTGLKTHKKIASRATAFKEPYKVIPTPTALWNIKAQAPLCCPALNSAWCQPQGGRSKPPGTELGK